MNDGDKVENIEKRIEHYQAALTVQTRENWARDWARTQSAFDAGDPLRPARLLLSDPFNNA